MRVPRLGTLQRVRDAGPNDPVFDILLVSGPLVVIGVALGGRTIVTVTVAAAYLTCLVGYILYNGVT